MEKSFRDDEDSSSERFDSLSVRDFELLKAKKPSRKSIVHMVTLGLLACAAAALSIWAMVSAMRLHKSASNFVLDCGSSIAEARAKGCKFDRVLFAYVPQVCYAHDLQQEYLSREADAVWFLNWDKTPVTDTTAIHAGEVDQIYTNANFSSQQCTYSWESLSRALNDTKPVVLQVLDLKQSRQCSDFFMAVFDQGLNWKTGMWLETSLQFAKCQHLSTDELSYVG